MEREVKYIDKINDLCKWKTKAKNQLKILYKMQKNHVSSVDYKKLLNKYKMLSERHASLQTIEADYKYAVAGRQDAERI